MRTLVRSPRPAAAPRRTGPLTIAHRGASHDAPENTVAAVRLAVEQGADLVEVDVQRTRDGALVILHDATPARTTDVRRVLPHRSSWEIGDLTLDEVRRLDAGSWKAPAYAGEPVPLLEDVLDTLAGTGVGLVLELKRPAQHPGVVADVAASLLRHRAFTEPALAAGRLIVQSFDVAAAAEHAVLAPSVPVGVLGQPPISELRALAGWATQVNPHHVAVDRAYVERIHDAGMGCLTWTVDRAFSQRRVVRAGVDGVITNRPAAFARALGGTAGPVSQVA